MRKAGVLVASVAAASSMAVPHPHVSTSSSTSSDAVRLVVFSPSCSRQEVSSSSPAKEEGGPRNGAADDRFAPRFDGLRFIETLVTAHR